MDKIKFIFVLILTVVAIISYLKEKGVNNIDSLLTLLIIKIRDKFNSSQTQEKLEDVIKEAKESIPFLGILDKIPLLNRYITKILTDRINKIFSTILKDDFYKTENKQISILDNVESLIKSNVEPMELLTKVTEMKKDIEEKGAITAFIESDFKNTKIGAKITKKF